MREPYPTPDVYSLPLLMCIYATLNRIEQYIIGANSIRIHLVFQNTLLPCVRRLSSAAVSPTCDSFAAGRSNNRWQLPATYFYVKENRWVDKGTGPLFTVVVANALCYLRSYSCFAESKRPEKWVLCRSTRSGLRSIVIKYVFYRDFHSYSKQNETVYYKNLFQLFRRISPRQDTIIRFLFILYTSKNVLKS